MATVGWIKVGLSADTGQFVKSMDVAAKAVEKLQRSGFRDLSAGTKMMSAGLADVAAGFRTLAPAAASAAKGLASGTRNFVKGSLEGWREIGAVFAKTPFGKFVADWGKVAVGVFLPKVTAPLVDAARASVDSLAFVYGGAGRKIASALGKAGGPVAAAVKASLGSLDFVYGPAVRAIGNGLGKAFAKIPDMKAVGGGALQLGAGLVKVGTGAAIAARGLAKLGAAQGLKLLIGGASGIAGIGSSFAHVASGLASGALKIAGTAALAGGALGAIVKHSMDASDAVHGMARELGVSNEELSKLHHAAKVAGVDAGTLDGSLEKLNQNLGKIAQEGTGPAADALRRFGLSARQMADAGPTAAFEQSIDLLARIPNAAERAAVAVELFGKSGQAMIRLAGEGKGAIERLKAEAVALGVAISDVDSEKIGEANNALGRVWDVVQGIANSIAVRLSPYLTYVADQFVDWAKEGGRAGSIVSQGVDWVTTGFGYAADAVQVLTAGFYAMRSGFMEALSFMAQGIDRLIQGFGALFERITGTKIELTDFAKTWSELLEKSAVADLDKAAATWNQKWAHEGVRKLVDEIQVAAQGRAQLAADKEAEFRKGGAFEAAKTKELGFGSATEMGSTSAASAVAKARGQQISGIQNQIATASKTTAEATTRTAVAAERMAQAMDRQAQGAGQGALMTAGL